MTCIAAKLYPGSRRAVFAWDSQTTDGEMIIIDTVPKVTSVESWGPIGSCGTVAAIDAGLEAFQTIGDPRRLVHHLRALELEGSATWLLVYECRLMLLDSDGAVVRPASDWWAIGSARELALGAMAVGASPRRAVEVACELSSACAPPVRVLDWRY